jgi:tRNA-specific 2-thiouridylase
MTKERVLVAMSGGVDSTACARDLLDAGYETVGVTMRLCDAESEVCERARLVCDLLGMEHRALECTDAFSREVIAPFIASYEKGETPNPCILCNRTQKFGTLLRLADELGCQKLATGHYARVEYDEASGRYLLKKAKNAKKDQTYVLYFLSQEQLSRVLFPLGEYESKDAVRARVAELSLPNAKQKDSQDICFIPDGDYAAFIEKSTKKSYPCGNFLDTEGKILGRHLGTHRYTVGQRKGLGIALGEPMYVKSKNADDATVTLCRDAELYTRECTVRETSFLPFDVPDAPIRASVKTRYSAKEASATITPLDGGRAHIRFDDPVRAITPGQAAVFYDGDTVLGGGIIED